MMKKQLNYSQLVRKNKAEILENHEALTKIERRIEQKHLASEKGKTILLK